MFMYDLFSRLTFFFFVVMKYGMVVRKVSMISILSLFYNIYSCFFLYSHSHLRVNSW